MMAVRTLQPWSMSLLFLLALGGQSACDRTQPSAAPAAAASAEPPMIFAVDGKDQQSLPKAKLLQQFKPVVVRVWDPFEQAEVAFDAIPLQPVLDAGLGPQWRQRKDLLFVAKDGYSAPISVARLLAKPAWLAFARAGGAPLTLQPNAGGKIDAAPWYVVWDSLNDTALRAEGDHGWPFQTVRIEAVDLLARYPRLQLPPGASAAAQRGATVFAGWCLPCHAIGGQGGSVGPELAEPVGVVHTWQSQWLAAWIDNPAGVRRGARMPPPPLPEGDRKAHIADVIAFLHAVSPTPTDVP